jgi:hypothetical protein
MKAALLILIFVAAATPASANPHVNCASVRAYVSEVGLVQAKALARAAGMTASQERRARRCFAKAD